MKLNKEKNPLRDAKKNNTTTPLAKEEMSPS